MNKIDYQALREKAEKAKELGNISRYTKAMIALLEFKEAATPDAVLALLDELEASGKLIDTLRQGKDKVIDMSIERVNKLLSRAEAAEKRIAELESLTAPQLPQPAPVSVPEVVGWEDVPEEITEDDIALASLEAEPVNQTYNLPELIEGMEVSIDVSTCDADLGNRYFGTVTEALELDTAKNGYILLVQDAEPNFDVNSNSPVTPDGWISCSDRMPPQDDWILIYSKHGEYMAGQVQGEYVELSDGTLSWLGNALFWMPLPEPPQEVK